MSETRDGNNSTAFVLTGSDYSKLAKEKLEEYLRSSQETTEAEGTVETDSLEWEYSHLFVGDGTTFNLGIEAEQKLGCETELYSKEYVGVMPLWKRNGRTVSKTDKWISINSRFFISPTEMINEVMKGNDFYETPSLFQFKCYTCQTWLKEMQSGAKETNEKVLFGIIKGAGKIDLPAGGSAGAAHTDNYVEQIVNAFGAIEIIDFLSKAKALCSRSLKRGAERVKENLNGKVKGRILVNEQIKNNVVRGQDYKVFCSYNVMSDNILENQIIKYVLNICAKSELGEALSEDIMYCKRALQGVKDRKCTVSDLRGIKTNGAFRQYKETLEAAKKVMTRYAINYQKDSQETNSNSSEERNGLKTINYKVEPFFINMNLLFEYYCRALVRKAIDSYNQKQTADKRLFLESAEQAKRKVLVEEDSFVRKFYMKEYIPDIVIRHRQPAEQPIFAVLDAKYSDVEDAWMEKRGRTHQIIFYMDMLSCGVGGLISPWRPGAKEKELLKSDEKAGIAQRFIGESSNAKTLLYIPLMEQGLYNSGTEKVSDCYVEEIKDFLENITGRKE